MTTVERIRTLLTDIERVPLYDPSGKIITPTGAEAAIEARAVRRCLRIAEEEENRCSPLNHSPE